MFPEPRNSLRFDTSERLTIKPSIMKSIGTIMLSLCSVAFGVWLARGGAIETRLGVLSIPLGWIFFTLFSGVAVLTLIHVLHGRKAKLILSPSGLRYPPTYSIEIPWSSITAVSRWKYTSRHRGFFTSEPVPSSLVQLQMRPDDFSVLHSTWTKTTRFLERLRCILQISKPIEKDCTFISSSNLQVSTSELFTTIYAYAQAHSPAVAART